METMILGTPKSSAHRLSPGQLVARANSRAGSQYRKNSVGADLHSIMDDQGLLNPLVARQMSVMSHYSVRSESGSVLITPVPNPKPEFRLLKLIGRGGFGNVYLGEWSADGERIAVKIIQGYNNADQPDEQEWEERKERMAQMEAVLMSAIAHDNIVRTMKVIAHQGEQVDPELAAVEKQLLKGHAPAGSKDQDSGPPSFEWHIVMEYCDKGSLSRALSAFMLHSPIDAGSVKWDAWASVEILKEVTRSLMFLHEHKILHGDLKAANVLLTSSSQDRRKYISKISDFGLSRVLQNDKNHIKTQTFGTVTHVPPELLAKGTLSPKADIYAIGILMWEIFTAEKVFKQLSDAEVILSVVTKKARPTFPSDVPSRYKFLAERCWSEMMELRPTLQTVMNELETLQKTLCPEGSDSSPITCKVYPSRAKALSELLHRQRQAAERQAAAEKAYPGDRPITQTGSGSPPKLPPALRSNSSTAASAATGGAAAFPLSPLSGAVREFNIKPMGRAIGIHQVESSYASFGPSSSTPGAGGASPGPMSRFHSSSTGPGPVISSPRVLGSGSYSLGTAVAPLPGLELSKSYSPGSATGKQRSSAGRTLSSLAPQYVGSPERVNPELSIQRPAEPRGSLPRHDMLPALAAGPPTPLQAAGPVPMISPPQFAAAAGRGNESRSLFSRSPSAQKESPTHIQVHPPGFHSSMTSSSQVLVASAALCATTIAKERAVNFAT